MSDDKHPSWTVYTNFDAVKGDFSQPMPAAAVASVLSLRRIEVVWNAWLYPHKQSFISKFIHAFYNELGNHHRYTPGKDVLAKKRGYNPRYTPKGRTKCLTKPNGKKGSQYEYVPFPTRAYHDMYVYCYTEYFVTESAYPAIVKYLKELEERYGPHRRKQHSNTNDAGKTVS